MATRRPGPFAPLSSYYYDDAAIMEAGEAAELLYVRMLAYASRQLEFEGFIPKAVIETRLGVTPITVSGNCVNSSSNFVSGTSVQDRIRKLCEVGLVDEVEGGYVIRSWLKWNRSAAEMGKDKANDRKRKTPLDQRVSGKSVNSSSKNASGKSGVSRRNDQTRPDQTNNIMSEVAEATPDPTPKTVEPEREDVTRLCEHLADRIEANGSKRPTITKTWRTAARLMIDKDGHTPDQIHAAIDWAQDNEFWRANILSMPKLRDQYDQLRLQAQRQPSGGYRNQNQIMSDMRTANSVQPGIVGGNAMRLIAGGTQ